MLRPFFVYCEDIDQITLLRTNESTTQNVLPHLSIEYSKPTLPTVKNTQGLSQAKCT